MQYSHANYFSSPVTMVNTYYVIGRTDPPDDLQNLSLAVVGGQAPAALGPRRRPRRAVRRLGHVPA
ncbi:MAG: hypothetical protein IPK78_18960 [Rhodospirillales bacterium]|nr:hypothetical protein [Rhodospirillales bacterium]